MNNTKRQSPVQKLRRQQTALAQFGSYAFRATHLSAVLTEAARQCADGLDVRFCKVLRYRADTDDLIVEAGVGWHENVIGSAISKADTSSPGGRAFITGKPVVTADLHKKHDFVLPPLYIDHDIRSTVNVIIQGFGEEPYGVLEVDSPAVRNFAKQDIDFLQGFANVVAGAVALSLRMEALQSTVTQKEVLARELQHRVRNNLQVVYHMLTRQAESTKDADAKRGIEDVARRVVVLGHVYEHLLGVGLTHVIDFGEYLQSLCRSLADFYQAENPEVNLSCEADTLVMDVEKASALGICVNELIANSYEHAFHDGKGAIGISLRHDKAQRKATLTISDDGLGFVQKSESSRNGLRLVDGLVHQVGGTIAVDSDSKTTWTITIPVQDRPQTGGRRA